MKRDHVFDPSAKTIDMGNVRVILAGGCQMPGCPCGGKPTPEIVLGPDCHPTSPVYAAVHESGVLALCCATCARPVANVRIAEEPSKGDA